MNDSEFDRQLEELYPAMDRWAYRYVDTLTKRQDLVHDTVVRVLSARSSFNPNRSFKAWVSAIMKNCFLDGYRRPARRTESRTQEIADHHTIAPASQEAYCDVSKVHKLLQGISQKARTAFELSLQGHADSEVAVVMQVPLGTAKAWIRRTRLLTQERLALL